MWSATLGAAPVYLCTWAASAIFSNGSRGTPACAKTLNRVPELPNAHEGSSIRWCPSTSFTALSSTIRLPCCERGAGAPADRAPLVGVRQLGDAVQGLRA